MEETSLSQWQLWNIFSQDSIISSRINSKNWVSTFGFKVDLPLRRWPVAGCPRWRPGVRKRPGWSGRPQEVLQRCWLGGFVLGCGLKSPKKPSRFDWNDWFENDWIRKAICLNLTKDLNVETSPFVSNLFSYNPCVWWDSPTYTPNPLEPRFQTSAQAEVDVIHGDPFGEHS